MSQRIQFISLIIASLILFSCCRKMSYDNYNKYINNPKNGLLQEKLVNGINYKLTYRPAELMVNQYQQAYDTLSEKGINTLREQYKQYYHILLSISYGKVEALKGATNFQQFSSLMQEMGFGMDKNVYLFTNERDTLQLIDFHFARYFGMGKSNDILFVFKKEEKPADILTFHLNEFGLKTGDVRFSFNTADLKRIDKKKIKD